MLKSVYVGESVAQFIVPMAEEIDEHIEPLLAGPSSSSEEAPSRNTPPFTKKKWKHDASFKL